MSILKPFNLARYLAETDAQFARIQADIDRSQPIVDMMYEVAETPAQRRFEGREPLAQEEKSVA